ncbi:pirin family protein [Burkholderia sp. Bp8963]|uniref:pirin family protein n=1 Tax=Burkholderia sp. Bp8963 TaxID=2184547 RepID=UPI0021AB54BA|nr:pirin family protein [Burkholderia sp. Bp8963]
MPIADAATKRHVVFRTRGRRHGPVTRLMSPSDVGQMLRPFVFLDLVDVNGISAQGFGLHPHSGIATITWMLEGSVGYEDTMGRTGQISKGGLEWMHAGGGAWHGGDFGDGGPVRAFQLWIALPAETELGKAESIYLQGDAIEHDGPVTVLLGRYGSAKSAIDVPSPITYLSVSLKAGERWRFQPPKGQTVGWTAISRGALVAPDALDALAAGELVVFAESDDAIEFEAETDAEFVVGSAVKHPHDLVLGYYSVHTSEDALREGESRIQKIGMQLRKEGRLRR